MAIRASFNCFIVAGSSLMPLSSTVWLPTGMPAFTSFSQAAIEAGVISTYILGRDAANTYAAGGALTSKFINGKPDVARRYALAWSKAIADIKSDEAGVRKHLIKNTFTPANVAPTIPMVNYTMVRDLNQANLKDFQDFIDFAHKVNVLKQKVDVTKYLKKY